MRPRVVHQNRPRPRFETVLQCANQWPPIEGTHLIGHNGSVKRPAPSVDTRPATSGESRGPVLVVETDPAVRRILSLVLEGAGFKCLSCASAEEALRIVSDHHPKLVVAEARLEKQGGSELARALANEGGWRPRVALMSAYPRRRRGYEDYFLAKPIAFDRLIQLAELVDHEPGW